MENVNSNKYLSLKNAAQIFGYTRDHLGLMIRREKLKGLKLGSYYVTTIDWMTEYIKNYADPVHPVSKNKLSNKFLNEALSAKNKDFSASSKISPLSVAIDKPRLTEKSYQENLQSNILKELSKLDEYSSKKTIDFSPISRNESVSENINSPFVILPIRKMNDFERTKILSLSQEKYSENDTKEIT